MVSLLSAKIVYVLGISNIVFGLLILFSCRCMLGLVIGKLMKYNWYRKFYSIHCWFWWLFIISVFLHAVLAIITYGNPF